MSTYSCDDLGLSIPWLAQKDKSEAGESSVGMHAASHGVENHGDEVGRIKTVIESHRAYNKSCVLKKDCTTK